MSQEKTDGLDAAPKKVTKKDVEETLQAIEKQIVESHSSYMHAVITLDHILRAPNAGEVFDKKLKEQAKDLWLKVKSTGLQLNDPPLLFGVPTDGNGAKSAN